MNIYNFFNSGDVAEYCRNMKHVFTAKEKAFLIWNSNHHTLTEKHKAWQKIIDTMPDEFLPENYWINTSLHDFLHSIMKLQNEFIQDFISAKSGYIYTVENLYQYSGIHFTRDWFFSDYKSCLDSVKKTVSKNYYELIKITRHELHGSAVSALNDDEAPEGYDALVLNEKLAVVNIETADYDCGPDDKRFYLDPSFVFEDLPISIPSPFHRGDIVKDASEHWLHSNNKPPFVVESYPLMPAASESGAIRQNRSVKGWYQTSDRDIFWNYGDDYLNLVRHVPEETNPFLQNVSEYLKGSIPAEVLLQRHEEFLKRNTMLPELVRKEEKRNNACSKE